MISKVFVINLSIRRDRYDNLLTFFPENALGSPIRWGAVHGDSCKPPPFWNAGNGAWGCYRSHLQILEYCMSEKIHSYMVLEDDAVFVNDFDQKYDAFLEELPTDWDMFYLGGQLMHAERFSPERVSANVYRPYNVNRTHCFAVHSRCYEYLYQFLLRRFEQRNWHIDHHLGRLHEQRECNIYCPGEWLVGQGSGSSNISGRVNEETYFPHPKHYYRVPLEKDPYCFILEAPVEIAKELTEKHGWHSGFSRDENFIDRGLELIDYKTALKIRHWYAYIIKECSERDLIPFLWHPKLTYERVKELNLPFKPIQLKPNSIEDCLSCYESVMSSRNGTANLQTKN